MSMYAITNAYMQQGRYQKALEYADSVMTQYKKEMHEPPTGFMYITKDLVLISMEEWEQVIINTNEYLFLHKGILEDSIAAEIYSHQGYGYYNLKKYQDAIKSYEKALDYCYKINKMGIAGGVLCDLGHCNRKLGKTFLASSLLEKGLERYFEYFGFDRNYLMRYRPKETDALRKSFLDVLSVHLYKMAIYAEEDGDNKAKKNYLLMSAHCGNETAKSEYYRIYGYYVP